MKITQIFLMAIALAITACGNDGTARPAQATIRVFHSASNFDVLRLLREKTLEVNVGFGRGATDSFDSGPYQFVFQTLVAGLIPTDLYTFTTTIAAGQTTNIVAYSTGDQLGAFLVPTTNLAPSATHTRYTVINADQTRDNVDIYIVPSGTDLTTVAPQGSAEFGPNAAQFEVLPGAYKLFLTPAGEPAAPFYESVEFDLVAGVDKTLVVFDPGAQSLADVDVAELLPNGAARLLQVGVESRFRVVMAVDDRNEDREIYLNEDATPFFAGPLPFGEPTPATVIPPGGYSVNLTPLGNPGTVESSTLFAPVPGLSYLTAFAGDTTDGIDPSSLVEDTRSIVGQATVTILHAAGLFDTINVFVHDADSEYFLFRPNVQFVRAPAVTERLPFIPGDYAITIRNPETATTLAGPIPVTLESGGVYGFMLVNGEDGATIDVKYLYDLAP